MKKNQSKIETLINENGVEMNFIETDRFIGSTLKIMFFDSLTKEHAFRNAVLAGLLSSCSKKYPDVRAVKIHLDEMCGVGLEADVERYGNMQSIEFSFDFLSSDTAEEIFPEECKEKTISESVWDFAEDLLIDPLAKNGAFDDKMLKSEIRNHLSRIKTQRNHKQDAAVMDAERMIREKNEYDVELFGVKEDAEDISGDNLFKYYEEHFLGEMQIKIYFAGGRKDAEILRQKVKNSTLTSHKRKNVALPGLPDAKYRGNVTVEKHLASDQDVSVVIGAKPLKRCTTPKSLAAFSVLSSLIGESPISRMYIKLRQENQLAYSCYSGFSALNASILIAADVACENLTRAVEEIENIKDTIKGGLYSDNELEVARKYAASFTRQTDDSTHALISHYLWLSLQSIEQISPEKYAAMEEAVTREDISEASEHLEFLGYAFLAKGGDVQ